MREILFRGKREDNGKWVEGGYYHGVNYDGDSIDEHYIIPFYDQYDEDLELNKVDPKTICQFTGLLDKNGKKIFEGDILSQIDKHDKKPLIRVVKYEMSCGCCCTQVIGFGASGHFHLDFIRLDEPVEIIGNIHDNPELLEVER